MNGGFKSLRVSWCSVLIVIHAACVEGASELVFYFVSGRIVRKSLKTHGWSWLSTGERGAWSETV